MSDLPEGRMRLAILVAHAVLLCALSARILALPLSAAATALALLVTASPLLLALKGLLAASAHTAQWLSIALVFYVGGGLVETVASGGQARSAVLLFLAALVELGLLLMSFKRAPTKSAGSAES
jgi:uncharacterized membrane protein